MVRIMGFKEWMFPEKYVLLNILSFGVIVANNNSSFIYSKLTIEHDKIIKLDKKSI